MTHDPICLKFYSACYCDLIDKVRDHVSSEIIQYAKETHDPHDPRIPCQRCDIVAAYNYAAQIAKGK